MKISEFSGNGEFRNKPKKFFIHKNKNFQKTKNFSGRESPALVILFDGISKFWVQIPPSRPEIQALLSFVKKKHTRFFFFCRSRKLKQVLMQF